jgi:acetoacetyl-CoA synthetase
MASWLTMTPPILWTPPAALLERATMGAYMRERGFSTYADLQRWSVEDLDGFWGSIWDRFEVGERGSTVLESRAMPGASWFPGTSVNYAEHAFRDRRDDALAMIAGSEDRDDVEWTWGALRSLTARIAAGLRALGVSRGDRVAAYMPNIPETAAWPARRWGRCGPPALRTSARAA